MSITPLMPVYPRCGFRPVRAFRSETLNVPKPGIVTLSPPRTVFSTMSMSALTAFSLSDLVSPADPATASISSVLFTRNLLVH